jgi:adenylate kinase
MIAFIAGVHGVGKTYLSAKIAKELGVKHATASQLIREERNEQSWSIDKRVSKIDSNQLALVSAVRRIQESRQSLLLDGHFVLREEKAKHTAIPEAVFRKLNINAIILIEADENIILERLVHRGDNTWDAEEIKAFMEKEEMHARHVVANLGIPLRILKSPSQIEFKAALEDLIKPHTR